MSFDLEEMARRGDLALLIWLSEQCDLKIKEHQEEIILEQKAKDLYDKYIKIKRDNMYDS